jgi:hypothetical protein
LEPFYTLKNDEFAKTGSGQAGWNVENEAFSAGWDRGYEWWLATEAKKRNPDIALASLSWCIPGWVEGGGLAPADVGFHVDFVRGAKEHHNLTLDYVGVLNEASFTSEYVVSLRAALDAAGFRTTKLVASDQGNWGIYDAMTKNQVWNAPFSLVKLGSFAKIGSGQTQAQLTKAVAFVPHNTVPDGRSGRHRYTPLALLPSSWRRDRSLRDATR